MQTSASAHLHVRKTLQRYNKNLRYANLRREKRRVAPPNSLHQRVRIALCFTLCAGCKLRKHKAIQAVNFPVLLVISGVYGDDIFLLNNGTWKCIRGSYMTYVE